MTLYLGSEIPQGIIFEKASKSGFTFSANPCIVYHLKYKMNEEKGGERREARREGGETRGRRDDREARREGGEREAREERGDT